MISYGLEVLYFNCRSPVSDSAINNHGVEKTEARSGWWRKNGQTTTTLWGKKG